MIINVANCVVMLGWLPSNLLIIQFVHILRFQINHNHVREF